AGEAELAKELAAMETELNRLHEQVAQNTSNPGEWLTRLPVLDALYDGNVRIDQNWLPDLTIDFNFSNVARFDRCKTCHQAISSTAPGTATDPAYPTLADDERILTIEMTAPDDQPKDDATLRDVYGLVLTDQGVVETPFVTVHYVLPETPAAVAGLESGDVLLEVQGAQAYSPQAVKELLIDAVEPESTISIRVERGLDHPFTTHPRLDLYLTDLSPHPEKKFGCTICHDGQGSGTEFKWTSHTPDDFAQQRRWLGEYGWFDNHHWIFPMKPARFVESNCLKCHHEKGGLQPSERFPDPPAPKLVEGWTLVESFGCFGCHEVNGYEGPDKRVGPDVRIEPVYHEAAAQLLKDAGLTEAEQGYAQRLIARPDDVETRELLYASIIGDKRLADDPESAEGARLDPASHKVAALLKGVDAPGKYRKVGPSLRRIESKVDFDWLYAWIRKPSDFRPSTKM
ncbi:MAG: PDZ domain-containing protein, partial [Planctomycetota bacterium]